MQNFVDLHGQVQPHLVAENRPVDPTEHHARVHLPRSYTIEMVTTLINQDMVDAGYSKYGKSSIHRLMKENFWMLHVTRTPTMAACDTCTRQDLVRAPTMDPDHI